MADSKLTALSEISVPALEDLLYWVDDPSGTPVSDKCSANRAFGLLNHICQGRLTLESGVPVSTSDQTGKTNIYFTPYFGNKIAVYDGTRWKLYAFSELTLALGTLSDATNYDVFVYDNAGTLTLEALAWTNGTTRATAITLQDGIYCKSGALTRRYLGTFRTTATTTTEDSAAKRFVWNAQNRVERLVKIYDSGSTTWSYASQTWRAANGNSANRVSVVVGVAGWSLMDLTLWVGTSIAGNSSYVMSLSLDSTSGPGTLAVNKVYINTTGGPSPQVIRIADYTALGYHYYQWVEACDNGVSVTVYSVDDGPSGADSGPNSAAYGVWQS